MLICWRWSSWWFQPIRKICWSNWITSPRFGVGIKNLGNHHLVILHHLQCFLHKPNIVDSMLFQPKKQKTWRMITPPKSKKNLKIDDWKTSWCCGIAYLGVSKANGIPKSSILIGFSIIFTIHFGGVLPLFLVQHPFVGAPICKLP